MQHLHGVYSQVSGILRFFLGVDQAQRDLVELRLRDGVKLVPRGKYCRRSRLVFSFVPRCQGLCGAQKETCTSVATVNALCLAISNPRYHVNERRRVAGSLRTRLLNAATTTAVSLLGTLISMRNRECRSTNVTI